jgi:hypothetical protein
VLGVLAALLRRRHPPAEQDAAHAACSVYLVIRAMQAHAAACACTCRFFNLLSTPKYVAAFFEVQRPFRV